AHDAHYLLGVRQRNRVLKLAAGRSEPAALQGNRSLAVRNAHSGFVAVGMGDETVAYPNGSCDGLFPTIVRNEEFSLDFQRHHRPRRGPIIPVKLVWGMPEMIPSQRLIQPAAPPDVDGPAQSVSSQAAG